VAFDTKLRVDQLSQGIGLVWDLDGASSVLLAAGNPVIIETVASRDADLQRVESGYLDITELSPSEFIGVAEVSDANGGRYSVEDRWTEVDKGHWRVDRTLGVLVAVPGCGVRLVLEIGVGATGSKSFEDFQYFAPAAMYDLNDLNGDHVDDYSDTQTLLYREDRLSAMSVLAYDSADRVAISLSRADIPTFDSLMDRQVGDTVVFQRTDIGSIGVFPSGTPSDGCVLTSAYPFVERDRSHALLVKERPAWGAFWPVAADEVLTVSYIVGVTEATTPHEALWDLWRRRMDDLSPKVVALDVSLGEITAFRVEALMAYYAEDAESSAAGFVTNCHPQDGAQLGNVIQYGFTGQNVLNAYCLLRADARGEIAAERRRRALRVIEFYVMNARLNEHGLARGLYNMDLRRYGSWWTGLLLPLAYADPGDDLERLMGPVYERLLPVIEALQGREGTYLRCLAEEYDSLLHAYASEQDNGVEHTEWFEAVDRFATFLLGAQQPDGSWLRAYDLDGAPLTDPDIWFGQTDVQRKSSTATVVPLLLHLHRLTGEDKWRDAAARACDYVAKEFVQGLNFNGGIHDSMYAKPQLVDHESIIFAFRALLEMYHCTREDRYLTDATRAAWVACTWAWLWDVPLPAESTFARYGFRTTGWTGCDAPGAGYIHPMGVIVVPDLVEIAKLTGDLTFLKTAELILAACNENVAMPGKDWGYARPGLQEEGLQVSWCWLDDPMFTGTEFGGRGKGEGNKTCFPWISAVTIWSYQEMIARYGTTDVWAAAGAREVVQR
jgi:hypothetical protein